jgi:prepilin-type N-terminal cleavage/methylation domain-containing protein
MTTARRPRLLRMHAGFSMIEVTASMAIFGIIAAGLAANTIAVVRANRISNGVSVATALAQDEIEQLRALDPGANPPALTVGQHTDPNNPLTPSGATGGHYTRQWTVSRDTPIAGLTTVVVSVSWADGATRTLRASALLCQSATCG